MSLEDEIAATHRATWQAHEEHLHALMATRHRAQAEGLPGLVVLLNLAQFAGIFNYDLSLFSYDLTTLPSGWKQNLQARTACHLISDYMGDIDRLLNDEFKAVLNDLSLSLATRGLFDQVRTDLRGLRATHEEFLATVLGAEREYNAERKLSAILNIDINLVLKLLNDLTSWHTSLGTFISTLLQEIPT